MSSATRRRLVPTSSPHGPGIESDNQTSGICPSIAYQAEILVLAVQRCRAPWCDVRLGYIRLYPDPDITEPDIIEYVLYCTGSFQPCLGKYEHTSSWPQAFGRAVAVLNDT